jgi:hypothetical protein
MGDCSLFNSQKKKKCFIRRNERFFSSAWFLKMVGKILFMQSKSSTSVLLLVLILVLTFPIWIGIAGGIFGIVMGLIGGFIGLIAGLFGAVGGIFGWLFNWDWPFTGFFHINFFWIIIVAIIIVLASKSRNRA